MNTNAVRIAVPDVNTYVNPNSLAWLGDKLAPLGSAAGQLQRELLKAAEQLVAEGTRRLDSLEAAPHEVPLPTAIGDAGNILAGSSFAHEWSALVARMTELHELLRATATQAG